MQNVNKELHDLLGEAKAIRFALENKAISYDEAKKRVKPLLERLNMTGAEIAKKYRIKYKKITFQSLGNNF